MFLCSVALELSNYDSCQSVHFCVFKQLSFCLVMYSGVIRVWFGRSLWEPEVIKVHV